MKTSAARLLLLSSTLTLSLFGQSTPTPPPAETSAAPDAPAAALDAAGTPPARARRGNFNPADMQARMMTNLREQLGVKDDAEWALISERITAIMELRRGQLAGALGVLFGNRGNRAGGPAASPEQDALRSALADNLPDAEITSRLARLREARKQNETKLNQARENLRAVLTVRQEAVAVMAGLLN